MEGKNIIPKYILGVDTYSKGDLSYCLVRDLNGEKDLILIKRMSDETAFEEEVKNIAKYFDAVIIKEYE